MFTVKDLSVKLTSYSYCWKLSSLISPWFHNFSGHFLGIQFTAFIDVIFLSSFLFHLVTVADAGVSVAQHVDVVLFPFVERPRDDVVNVGAQHLRTEVTSSISLHLVTL